MSAWTRRIKHSRSSNADEQGSSCTDNSRHGRLGRSTGCQTPEGGMPDSMPVGTPRCSILGISIATPRIPKQAAPNIKCERLALRNTGSALPPFVFQKKNKSCRRMTLLVLLVHGPTGVQASTQQRAPSTHHTNHATDPRRAGASSPHLTTPPSWWHSRSDGGGHVRSCSCCNSCSRPA